MAVVTIGPNSSAPAEYAVHGSSEADRVADRWKDAGEAQVGQVGHGAKRDVRGMTTVEVRARSMHDAPAQSGSFPARTAPAAAPRVGDRESELPRRASGHRETFGGCDLVGNAGADRREEGESGRRRLIGQNSIRSRDARQDRIEASGLDT